MVVVLLAACGVSRPQLSLDSQCRNDTTLDDGSGRRLRLLGEGTAFGAFTTACSGVASGEPSLVVPQLNPVGPPTDWVCDR